MAADAQQEKELITRCIRGNKDAWQDFICRYSSLVYFIVRKILYSRHCDMAREEIDDLHNDIFLSIIDNKGKKLRQYEGKNGCTVSSWVRVIAVRSTIDYLRKKRATRSLSEDETTRAVEQQSAPSGSPLKNLEDSERRQLLAEAIAELPGKDQLFLKLFYYKETPPQEIAALFHCTTSAVYSRASYLREKLRGAFKKTSKKKVFRSSI
jgi:RNA polymerase sigma-70 factor (ECF subfamily)